MQRRIFLENIDQKLTGNHGIQRNAGTLILVQRRLLLNDYQRSGLDLGHLKDRLYKLINGLVAEPGFRLLRAVKAEYRTDDVLPSQLLQRFTKLRLKYNNQRGNSQAEDILAQP